MRAGDGKRLCQEAEVYYYDFLCQNEAAVPESVSRHMAACPSCRERMRRLRETLFEAQRAPGPADSWHGETIEALTLQFELLDEHVTCCDIKSFLPKLAMVSPQIRIPTPVTVHVDHCAQCTEDLAVLRELNLTTDQLKRLSRFLESDRGEGVSPLRSHGWDAPHAGEQGRDGLATGAHGSLSVEDADIACHDVSTADLFNDVVPNGAPPDRRHRAIASHIRACPACRKKVRALHQTICGILERADSDTTTVYHAQSDTEGDGGQTTDRHRYPIEVQVLHGEFGSAADQDDSAADRVACPHGIGRFAGSPEAPRHNTWRLGRLARAVFVAVVLAALPTAWWISTPTASGTDVNDLLRTLAKAQNIQVITTNPNVGLAQEFLIARRSNTLVTKTKQECVLYDLDHRRKRTVEPGGGVGRPTRLSDAEYDNARELMANCLQDIMAGVSPDAKLHPSADDLGTKAVGNLDVYYRTIQVSHTGNSSLRNEWRVYVDPATGLPKRLELYREGSGETQWDLMSTTEFTYLTGQGMNDSIQALFPTK
jgi:hypothetical protein